MVDVWLWLIFGWWRDVQKIFRGHCPRKMLGICQYRNRGMAKVTNSDTSRHVASMVSLKGRISQAQMDADLNTIPKIGALPNYPFPSKSSILDHFSGIFPYKPSIWGYPHSWKPPNGCMRYESIAWYSGEHQVKAGTYWWSSEIYWDY